MNLSRVQESASLLPWVLVCGHGAPYAGTQGTLELLCQDPLAQPGREEAKPNPNNARLTPA